MNNIAFIALFIALARPLPIIADNLLPWPSNDSIEQATGACSPTNVQDRMSAAQALTSVNSTNYGEYTTFAADAHNMTDCYSSYNHPLYLLAAAYFWTISAEGYRMTNDSGNFQAAMNYTDEDLTLIDVYALPDAVQQIETQIRAIDHVLDNDVQ